MRRRNRNNFSFFWWFIPMIFIFGDTGAINVAIMFMLMMFLVVFAAVSASRSGGAIDSRRARRNRANLNDTLHSEADILRITVYLREVFRRQQAAALRLQSGEEIRLNKPLFKSLDDVDVYIDGHRFGTLYEYRVEKGRSYNVLMDELLALAMGEQNDADFIIDAEVVEKPTKRNYRPFQEKKDPIVEEYVEEEPVSEQERLNRQFIKQIDDLNVAIPDEEISNMMFETSALLKQLNYYQKKYPNTTMNYDKLYEYYLPILIRIFEQYENLQIAKDDPSYQDTVDNLKKTIRQINKALRKMISDTTDQDFMNLSADISTLDALLKKDGYASSANLDDVKESEGQIHE